MIILCNIKITILSDGFDLFIQKTLERFNVTGIDFYANHLIYNDGKFTIEETRCVGACGLAPVFTVNGEVYGKATPELLDKVISMDIDGVILNIDKLSQNNSFS